MARSTLDALGHARRTGRYLGVRHSVRPGHGLTGAGVAIPVSSAIGAAANQATLRRATAPAGRSLRPGRPDVRHVWNLGTVGIPLAGTVLAKVVVLAVHTFAAARPGTGRD
ncbi:hypothetical protein [Streptomyces sp. NPDC048665]|uniref:hypothetical protein n=1 Tax=Streptomyces sp. NPDC048665 TaxID=3155490 RepID=UPI00344455A2